MEGQQQSSGGKKKKKKKKRRKRKRSHTQTRIPMSQLTKLMPTSLKLRLTQVKMTKPFRRCRPTICRFRACTKSLMKQTSMISRQRGTRDEGRCGRRKKVKTRVKRICPTRAEIVDTSGTERTSTREVLLQKTGAWVLLTGQLPKGGGK